MCVPPFCFLSKIDVDLYLHDVFTNNEINFPRRFCFLQKSGFRRFSGLFEVSFLVYTSIIEQKRIAGQAKK